MRRIKFKKSEFVLQDKTLEKVYEKEITPFGTGAKIDAPKEYIGHRVYVVILKKQR